jgi:hypothetical protein
MIKRLWRWLRNHVPHWLRIWNPRWLPNPFYSPSLAVAEAFERGMREGIVKGGALEVKAHLSDLEQ